MGGANSSSRNNQQGQGLFGGGADDSQFSPEMLQSLAQQGQRQYNQRPHNPAPIEQNRTTVRNHFALVNSSINLIPEDSGDGRKLYHFEFEFSNTKPCSVSVYYAVTETLDSGARPTSHEAAFEQKDIAFPETGHNRKFSTKSFGLEPVDTAVADILKPKSGNTYPMIVCIRGSEDGSIASQSTYITASSVGEDKIKARVISTKIVVDGHDKAYDVQEIYGIASSNSAEEDNECIVCMCEPRDTTVMPCRHMCLCRSCAETLRKQTNKCPICREPVQSLLYINIDKNVTKK